MATRVVNILEERFQNVILVARPSKWGNPFKIGRDGNREEVVRKYKEWLLNQPDLMNSLHELKGQTLGCYCKPKLCHADILAELADLQGEQYEQANQ